MGRFGVSAGILLLGVLILVSPLPLGCVHCWSFFLLLFMVNLGSLLLWKDGREVSDGKVEALLYGLMGFMVFQLLPMPRFLLKALSPSGAKILTLALGKFNFHSLSLSPSRTLIYTVGFWSFLLLGWILWSRPWKREEVLFLTRAFVLLGLWESLFTVLKFLAHQKRVLVFWGASTGYPTGTLRNPDHFAALMEILFFVSLGYVYYKIKRDGFSRLLSSREVIFLISPVFIAFAMLLTHSRGGVVATGISLLFFLQLTAGRKVIPRYRKFYKIFLLSLMASVILLGGVFTYKKGFKIQRGNFWALSLEAFRDYPVFGSGFGTFPDLIETYRKDPKFFSLVVHAHNDYLEFLVEGGLVGFTLFFLPLVLVFYGGFQRWEGRRYPLVKYLGAGFMAGVVAAAFHSFFDFPLRIPAVALVFVVVFALATSIGRLRRER